MTGALIGVALLVGCGDAQRPGAAAPHELHVFNWASYIDPAVLDEFRQETGIVVRLATYPSAEILETTLLAGHSQYDVVVASNLSLQKILPAGALAPLANARLGHWGNLDTALLAQFAHFDPGNRFAVPYLWGVTGLSLNVSALRAAAPGVILDSWGVVFDPAIARQVARCRISVVDSPEDVFDTMLLYLGKEPTSELASDLDLATARLTQIRGLIAKISTDDQISDLASGETCAELTWSSNIAQAKRQARDAGNTSELRFVIPREGALIYIDSLAIPADAPHPDEAYAFINFMLRPEVAAQNANFVGGATPNRAALALIDPILRDDPAIYPPPEVIASLKPYHLRPPALTRFTTRAWTRFRTGT